MEAGSSKLDVATRVAVTTTGASIASCAAESSARTGAAAAVTTTAASAGALLHPLIPTGCMLHARPRNHGAAR
jgi:hypothetical protein